MKVLITIPLPEPRFEVIYNICDNVFWLMKMTETHVRFCEKEPFGCRSVKVEHGWIAIQSTGVQVGRIESGVLADELKAVLEARQ